MRSFLFVCDEDFRSKKVYSNRRTKSSDRWFFGDDEIINKRDKCLNIPLDPHNYRKVTFDDIITYGVDDLTFLASEFVKDYFSNKNELIISTSYTFGNNCPLLLEGLFDCNNNLIGPGLFLLISKNILTKIQESNIHNNCTLHCTWNGISNNGNFVDMFENLNTNNDSIDMIPMSPINETFGFCRSLRIRSINSLASTINEKRKAQNWRDISHYVFTIRLFDNFDDKNIVNDNCLGSITLISLGEGIKTKLSGQNSPWDVLDIAIKNSDQNDLNLSMNNFSNYISDFFFYPQQISVVYRLPFFISSLVPNHSKEIKFILNLMLFHQTLLDFFSQKNLENSYKKNSFFDSIENNLIGNKNLSMGNTFNSQDYGYDISNPIDSPDESSIFFQELNDAPVPPPDPINKIDNPLDSVILPNFSSKLTHLESEDELCHTPIENENCLEYNRVNQHSASELDILKMNNLKEEISALRQEMNILENTLIDKNEIIIRLEKLIDARDNIIRQNQEVIKSLKQDLLNESLKTEELKNKLKTPLKSTLNTDSLQERQKSASAFPKNRPSTANSVLLRKEKESNVSVESRGTKKEKIDFEKKLETSTRTSIEQVALDKTSFSGVARMALEKFIGN